MGEKYKNGKIYKITDIGYNKCYIGSTTEKTLKQRLARHNSNYKQYKNGTSHFLSSFTLFEEYGFENCKIELIEKYPCNSKDELVAREGHYI